MLVHLGVVVIAVALAGATSFAHRTQLSIEKGQTVVFDQHSFTFLGWQKILTPSENGVQGLVRIDGGGVFKPGVASFDGNQQGTGTPSIDSSVVDDVYLSLASGPASLPSNQPLVVEVYVQPLVMWMWVGGGMIFFGAILSAIPGKRRKPTQPASLYFPELASG
jgi:cytochrome c-type biogenesis protein CcmF